MLEAFGPVDDSVPETTNALGNEEGAHVEVKEHVFE